MALSFDPEIEVALKAAAEAADMSLFGFPNLATLGKLGG